VSIPLPPLTPGERAARDQELHWNSGGLSERPPLVEAVARLIATEYARGWKKHIEFVEEGQKKGSGLSPEEWANCNYEAFYEQAEKWIKSNAEIIFK
jgi:hypothetical protein